MDREDMSERMGRICRSTATNSNLGNHVFFYIYTLSQQHIKSIGNLLKEAIVFGILKLGFPMPGNWKVWVSYF